MHPMITTVLIMMVIPMARSNELGVVASPRAIQQTDFEIVGEEMEARLRPLIDTKYCEINPDHNPINTPTALCVPITNKRRQDMHTGTYLDHDFKVKGKMLVYDKTFTEYIAASLDWVLQHEWETLRIQEINHEIS